MIAPFTSTGALSVTESSIFNNGNAGVRDPARFEWFIRGTSFDYNKTAFIFFSGSTGRILTSNSDRLRCSSSLLEWGLSLRDSEILVQASTGSDKYILDVWPQSLMLTIDDVRIWLNHAVQCFMPTQSHISGSINNLHGNGNRKTQAITGGKGNFSATNVTCF